MIYLHMNYSSNLPFFGDPYFYSKNPTHPEPNGSVDGKIIELGDCPSPWLPEGSNHWKFHEIMKLFVFHKTDQNI